MGADTSGAAEAGLLGGVPRGDAGQKLVDIKITRMEHHHVVVVAQLSDRDQGGLATRPRILVVQDHRPAAQRLQLGHILVAVDDLGVAVPAEVGVISIQPQSLITGVRQQIGNRGYDGRQLGRVVLTMAEHVEEDLEDAVLDLGVPLRRKTRIGRLHRGHLRFAIFPRRLDGDVDVVAATRHVGPPGGPDVVHRYFEAVGPEQVERHVPHQFELALIGAGLDPLEDVGPRGRLGIEVPPDDRVELLEAFEGGEVEIRKTIGGKNDLAMLVDFVGLHCRSPVSMGTLGGWNIARCDGARTDSLTCPDRRSPPKPVQ